MIASKTLTPNLTIENETLLKAVYASLNENMKNHSENITPELPMLLCNVTPQIQFLEDANKFKLFHFSKFCCYTITQLIDILECQYCFFNSYLFNLENEKFIETCQLIVSNQNLWNLFINYPNIAKKLIDTFKDAEDIDSKAKDLLLLLTSNSSFDFIKYLFD